MGIMGPIGSTYVPVTNLPAWVVDLLNGLIWLHLAVFVFFIIMLTRSFLNSQADEIEEDVKRVG